jgi:hypothetical protein
MVCDSLICYLLFTDDFVDEWPLMKSFTPILMMLGAYLLFVLKVGPNFMKNRPAMGLKKALIWYNAFQVLFSLFLVIKVLIDKTNNSIMMPEN